MITLKDISVGYGAELFNSKGIELSAGKVYALIGANGSGKSTFFRSLLGQQPLLKGMVQLDNEKIDLKNEKLRSRLFAFVGSSFEGVEFLSVEELILLGRTPYIGSMGRYSENDRKVLEETIQLFDLEDFRHLSTDKLSDGEKQIAAIARAIAQETKVVLLDEPTAFLDYGNKKRILDLLIFIAREKNKTVIMSTHDIDLCIQQEGIYILLIDHKNNELELCQNTVSKNEILKKGFGIV